MKPRLRRHNRRFAAFRSIIALMLREMSTQYGRSPGGYFWALIEPLGSISILAIGFSLLVHEPPLGKSFMYFYATGMMPFTMFSDVSGTTARALQFSRPLLSYPAVTWIDAILARFLLNALTTLAVAAILITAIMVLTGSLHEIDIGPVLSSFGLAAVLGLGVGCMNGVLGGLYPIWFMVWSILTRPLMIVSGVIFLYSDLPRAARDLLWYNPLVHVISLARSGFFPTYAASYASPLYVLLIAMPLMALGMLLMRRYYKDILSN